MSPARSAQVSAAGEPGPQGGTALGKAVCPQVARLPSLCHLVVRATASLALLTYPCCWCWENGQKACKAVKRHHL